MLRWLVITFFILSVGCFSDGPTRFDHTTPVVETKTEESIPEVQNRHIWQQPGLILSKLGVLADRTIVDIGAGSGYFAFRFLKGGANVIALDIDEKMIALMNNEAKYLPQEVRTKLEVRRSDPDHAGLADQQADIVFVANTYTYIADRAAYFNELLPAFSEEGRLIIVDFKKKNTAIGPPMSERMALGDVENELVKAGYTIVESDDTSLQFQYIITAEVAK